jgi:hypothetical protein
MIFVNMKGTLKTLCMETLDGETYDVEKSYYFHDFNESLYDGFLERVLHTKGRSI